MAVRPDRMPQNNSLSVNRSMRDIVSINELTLTHKNSGQCDDVTSWRLRWYHTLHGDNSLKSVERFDHKIFVCRFQASR
jgi:hypothetical protein